MKLFPKVSLLLAGILLSSELAALATDSQQPIEIQADFAELDDREGKTIYVGNVIVIQGSIKMTGDKLRVNFSQERDLEEVFIEGRPATFKQTPDKGDDVKGEAMLIEYHAQKGLLHLIHKARLTQGKRSSPSLSTHFFGVFGGIITRTLPPFFRRSFASGD